jgi:hypothetical protein
LTDAERSPPAYNDRSASVNCDRQKCESRADLVEIARLAEILWRIRPYTTKLAFSGTHYLIRRSSGCPPPRNNL